MIALLTAYVVVLDFGPRASTPIGLVVQVTAQKIVAVGAVLLLVYQSILAERVEQPVIHPTRVVGRERTLTSRD